MNEPRPTPRPPATVPKSADAASAGSASTAPGAVSSEASSGPAAPLTLDAVTQLYRTHAEDLRVVCREQRAHLERLGKGARPQLDDVEAEISYLLVRHHRPAQVIEIGALHGWSTTWLLHGLLDNGEGHLDSYDLVDRAAGLVPAALARERWTFHRGDVAARDAALPDPDLLFIDADHGRRFGRWYLEEYFPLLRPGTPVSVHDVFHERWSRPVSEGREVLRWLERRSATHFTAARHRAPHVLTAIEAVRRELGIEGARGTRTNPMIWFSLPRTQQPGGLHEVAASGVTSRSSHHLGVGP